jgi:hypothetical protein
MQPVASTAEILTYKVLNRLTESAWIDWAYEMLVAGFDTEHLVILAGMQQPLEYFEMRTITDNLMIELSLDYTNADMVISAYAAYLAKLGLTGEINHLSVLEKLKNIHIELEHYSPLADFYDLYYAKEDLQYSEDQWYIIGVDRSNIDQTITDCFKEWMQV